MIQTLLLLVVNFALAINIVYIKSPLIGVIVLFLYLTLNGYLAGRLWAKFIGIDSRLRGNDNIIEWLMGIFVTFFVISTLLGIIIAFYGYSEWVLVGVLVGVSVGLSIVHHRYYGFTPLKLYSYKAVEAIKLYSSKALQLNSRSSLIPILLAIILLFLIGFATLITSAAPEEYIKSPWEAIPGQFVWVVVVLSASILGLIFFRPKKYLLIFIILFSIMGHLYIPAVYRLPYALDDWRQIGMMEKIVAEGSIEPHSIAQTFISPKMSYAPFWGAAIWLKQALNVNLVKLTVWWQALFFSFFLPILLWILGRQLGTDILSVPDTTRRASPGRGQEVRTQPHTIPLLLAFLPALFYPLQVYGAISLPVGFSFLWFVLFLIAVVAYIKQPTKKLRALIGIAFIVMLFGYLVYWLFGLLIIGFLIIQRFRVVRTIYLFGSILFIPIISLWASPNARFDIAATGINYAADFWKHYTQYLLGFKNLGAPRPQAGNLIFHDMRQNFVDIWPFNWQYFDTMLLVVLVILLVFGLRRWVRISNPHPEQRAARFSGWGLDTPTQPLLLYLLFVSIGSIAVDWYYFGGIHLLSERMDLVVNLSLMLTLVYGIYFVILNFNFLIFKQFLIFKFLIIIFLAFCITATYISGPIYGRVTRAQFNAVKWLEEDMRAHQRQDFCVLSEHFSLSALEAVSAGRVSNGNFPMQYGYLETSGELFVSMFSRPNINWMKQATVLAGSPGCYLFIDQRHLADWNTLQLRWLLGREVYRVDGVYIWLYDDNNQ